MFDTLLFVVTLGAALGSGLIGGVFFAFSTFIMKALNRRPPSEAIAAMQAINVDVVQSGFIAAFLATALACVAVIIGALVRRESPGSMLLLVGGALYVLGSFGVTLICNVPLNNALADIAPAAPDNAQRWASYLSTWTLWNHVRTGASFAAAAALTIALIRYGRALR